MFPFLKVLDYLFCEVPVITSNISSMPEVAEDAAVLVNPHEVNEIANALLQYFENEDLRKEKIENGRRQKEKFNWDRTAEVIYAVL